MRESTRKHHPLDYFDYGDVVWDNCTGILSENLEQLHLDALRTIIGSVRGTSHEKLYVESGFIPLKERRERHKLILYFKIVKGMVPDYLVQLLPNLVSDLNPYHRRNPLERRTIFCRTELYKDSFFPSTTVLWNTLPDSAKRPDSLSLFKRYLRCDDHVVSPYYYVGNREAQVVHCKLRLNMSDLNYHLYLRYLSDNRSCPCGNEREDTRHYLKFCPLFQLQRTTHLQPYLHCTVQELLKGNPRLSSSDNENIFRAVQSFITATGRFRL